MPVYDPIILKNLYLKTEKKKIEEEGSYKMQTG